MLDGGETWERSGSASSQPVLPPKSRGCIGYGLVTCWAARHLNLVVLKSVVILYGGQMVHSAVLIFLIPCQGMRHFSHHLLFRAFICFSAASTQQRESTHSTQHTSYRSTNNNTTRVKAPRPVPCHGQRRFRW